MSVYSRVIVGTDGSATALEAVGVAAMLAGKLCVPLLVATVFQRTRPEDLGPPSVRAQMPGEGWVGTNYHAAANTAVEGAALAARTARVTAETATPEGDPAAALLELSQAHPGSLLAVGNRGMAVSARFLLGSVPGKITHHAVGDVLVVRAGRGESALLRRLLIATDGSATAWRAVERGVEIAVALAAEVTVLCASGDTADAREVVEQAGRRAAAAGVVWYPDLRSGPAADAVLDAAQGHDLVVMGNRGMTGPGRFLLGSVPNKVSHHIETSLLIVRTEH